MSQHEFPYLEEIAPEAAPDDALASLSVGATFAEIERELVLRTLTRCNGNRTHAARQLGVSVRTLRNRIRLYSARGIAVPAYGQAEPTLR